MLPISFSIKYHWKFTPTRILQISGHVMYKNAVKNTIAIIMLTVSKIYITLIPIRSYATKIL